MNENFESKEKRSSPCSFKDRQARNTQDAWNNIKINMILLWESEG